MSDVEVSPKKAIPLRALSRKKKKSPEMSTPDIKNGSGELDVSRTKIDEKVDEEVFGDNQNSKSDAKVSNGLDEANHAETDQEKATEKPVDQTPEEFVEQKPEAPEEEQPEGSPEELKEVENAEKEPETVENDEKTQEEEEFAMETSQSVSEEPQNEQANVENKVPIDDDIKVSMDDESQVPMEDKSQPLNGDEVSVPIEDEPLPSEIGPEEAHFESEATGEETVKPTEGEYVPMFPDEMPPMMPPMPVPPQLRAAPPPMPVIPNPAQHASMAIDDSDEESQGEKVLKFEVPSKEFFNRHPELHYIHNVKFNDQGEPVWREEVKDTSVLFPYYYRMNDVDYWADVKKLDINEKSEDSYISDNIMEFGLYNFICQTYEKRNEEDLYDRQYIFFNIWPLVFPCDHTNTKEKLTEHIWGRKGKVGSTKKREKTKVLKRNLMMEKVDIFQRKVLFVPILDVAAKHWLLLVVCNPGKAVEKLVEEKLTRGKIVEREELLKKETKLRSQKIDIEAKIEELKCLIKTEKEIKEQEELEEKKKLEEELKMEETETPTEETLGSEDTQESEMKEESEATVADTQEEIKPEVKMDETESEVETQPEAKEETMPEAEQEESKSEAKEGEETESKEEVDGAPVETPKDEEMKEESQVASNPSTPMLADEESEPEEGEKPSKDDHNDPEDENVSEEEEEEEDEELDDDEDDEEDSGLTIEERREHELQSLEEDLEEVTSSLARVSEEVDVFRESFPPTPTEDEATIYILDSLRLPGWPKRCDQFNVELSALLTEPDNLSTAPYRDQIFGKDDEDQDNKEEKWPEDSIDFEVKKNRDDERNHETTKLARMLPFRYHNPQVPHQVNEFDCAIFVHTFITMWFEQRPKMHEPKAILELWFNPKRIYKNRMLMRKSFDQAAGIQVNDAEFEAKMTDDEAEKHGYYETAQKSLEKLREKQERQKIEKERKEHERLREEQRRMLDEYRN